MGGMGMMSGTMPPTMGMMMLARNDHVFLR